MGLRNAAAICQRVKNAFVLILFKIGIQILNYLDDLAGAEKKENAKFAYCCLGAVFREMLRKLLIKPVPLQRV